MRNCTTFGAVEAHIRKEWTHSPNELLTQNRNRNMGEKVFPDDHAVPSPGDGALLPASGDIGSIPVAPLPFLHALQHGLLFFKGRPHGFLPFEGDFVHPFAGAIGLSAVVGCRGDPQDAVQGDVLVFDANENAHESVSLVDSDGPRDPRQTVWSARREIRVSRDCVPRPRPRVTATGEAPYIIGMCVRRHNLEA